MNVHHATNKVISMKLTWL